MEQTTKRCFCCRKNKSLSDYYVHSSMGDGHLNKCKDCVRDYQFRRIRGPAGDKVRAYDRSRFKNPERKVRTAEYQRKRRKKSPEKERARAMLGRAIRTGAMIRPAACSMCNKKCKPDGHHPDHAKPFEVVWVCRQCHLRKIHHQTM